MRHEPGCAGAIGGKPLLDKLGVKPGQRVAVIGVDDDGFLKQLAGRTEDVSNGRPKRHSTAIFFGATRKSDLARLSGLRDRITPDGAIWTVWPKGQPELREDDVRAAAIAAGLVDVKVVAFSATHSALKLVIPVAKRAAHARAAK
jgi:hypothetical protein